MKNYEKIHEKYLLVPERQTFKIFIYLLLNG